MRVRAPSPGETGGDQGVRVAGDEGQTTVLVVGLTVVCLLLATVILAVTTVNLEARKLLSAADGAAMAAADSFTIAIEEDGDARRTPVLADADAAEAVAGYLVTAGSHERFDGLVVETVSVGDGGQTVDVVLTATAHPPIVNWIVPDGIRILATSSSRTALRR
ncbi:pilus assembly protein TadG-related protein [Citricoccus alkalitolerans]|uniref:Pilus assembly protein TadG-related protein n=1 Tax=Citricoccus alkalitolerans TaxID=246603 RepID=A0ABV8XY73_9MICC